MAFTITEADYTTSQRKRLKYIGTTLNPPVTGIKNVILYLTQLQGDKGYDLRDKSIDLSTLTKVKSATDDTTVGTIRTAVASEFTNGD